MPPKTKFDREAIVDAAFAIAREEGFDGITARSVSSRLGCSVAPIYVNFKTIDDLLDAVIERITALAGELLARQEGPHPFENIGKASLAFAREYPVLFREMVLLDRRGAGDHGDPVDHDQVLVEAMGQDDELAGWSEGERRVLLLKMRAVHLGLSVLVANGQMPSWADASRVEALLIETGDELVLAGQMKRKDGTKQ